MPDFRCRLATPTGEIVERDFQAQDGAELRRDLERQDYLVLAIQRRSSFLTAATQIFRRRKKISTDEFLFFNQEFAALIKAGLPIVESLTLLIERRKNPIFKQALIDVRDKIRQGQSLSDSFAQTGLFPALFASSLSAGERSGEVASVILRYVAYTKTLNSVRRKVIAALIYPLILMTMAIGLVALLLIYVLPKFQTFFREFGSELPLITRSLLYMSSFLRGEWFIWIPLLVGSVFGIVIWRRTPAGTRAWEKLTYATPLVGSLARKFVVTRYARTLSTLVSGGIPVVTCLEVVGRSIGTPLYSEATRTISSRVREGAALWSSLEESKLFPDLMVEMTKVGESSGTVAEMLQHVADFTDQEIEHELQTLTSLIEPLLLVAMALMVGTLLLAIYYPLLQVYSNSTVG